ncbi:MAG: hypothetical protein R2706_03450 [Acidimicrobiales bacterium]
MAKMRPAQNDSGHDEATASQQNDRELIAATVEALNETMPAGLRGDQIVAAAGRLVETAVKQPQVFARRAAKLTGEYARIAAGRSDVAPNAKDRRFVDEAWTTNPFYKRLGQSYLAFDEQLHGFVADLEMDPKTRLRTEFLAHLAGDAVAPTNTLLGNPAALKEARRTKGRSLIDGARHAMYDMKENGGMPSMVDSRPFVPGDSVAATPGAVVFRNEVLELIQYTPTTTKVFERPMLVVPPQINKYYILDLAPGRSLFEHLVGAGHQVFTISWRNPGPEHRDWNLDTYAAAHSRGGRRNARHHRGRRSQHAWGLCWRHHYGRCARPSRRPRRYANPIGEFPRHDHRLGCAIDDGHDDVDPGHRSGNPTKSAPRHSER